VADAIEHATVTAISRVGFVECRAALARARRERRLRPADELRAVGDLERTFSRLAVVELDHVVAGEAARLAGDHPLRAADAIHLASAGVIAGEDPSGVRFACWDARLSDAAGRLGFTLIP
jgi:predicted nucleic acid-binding protein